MKVQRVAINPTIGEISIIKSNGVACWMIWNGVKSNIDICILYNS